MILSILKVIGMVLLIILALLILILGIILFVPIRYQFDAKYEDKPDADVLVRWSPILLKVIVNYHEGNFVYIIRMLGGVVMTNQDIPISWIGRKFFSSAEDGDNETDSINANDNDRSTNTKAQTDFVVLEDEIDLISPEDEGNQIKAKSSKIPDKKPSKQSMVKKIRRKIQSMKQSIRRWIEKLKELKKKKDALLTVYHSKRFEVAKKDAISYIKTLWRIIKPTKLEGYIHFGMSDPASTGQVLGILAMFLIWYDQYLELVPDFEKACMDGYLKGNGKFRLFPIIKLLIKIILNKNLIKVIKKVQTIIEA